MSERSETKSWESDDLYSFDIKTKRIGQNTGQAGCTVGEKSDLATKESGVEKPSKLLLWDICNLIGKEGWMEQSATISRG